MIQIRQNGPFRYGYNEITTMEEIQHNAMMDFGILRLAKGTAEKNAEPRERAYLLLEGEVTFAWEDHKATVKRANCFDENPCVLHVPQNKQVVITGVGEDSGIAVIKTANEREFAAKFYTQAECRSEERGKGTMKETSTRIVRTVFDYSNAPYSNLVVGEVIDYPGKWSSFPPHYHPQPEIYYYKFKPENGYGFSELGEDVIKLKNNDTVKILDNATHPQATAPGYAMYYLWVIRHIEGNPYITPTFVPEHVWVTEPDAVIWPDKK
ncbi:kdui/iolb isomerase [Lucifera butyrica]|uniref:Kdui/iolb isomerase n=1 Tax=Lucifera butyrica TaxID=1351585 RepID=A0A498R3K4_9FIRM|nr:5-deoxy-glucuronate isomerase [Lucifera butyrica]VBB05759.1 kdui/iolb isomerase [Lucifera butyrica]